MDKNQTKSGGYMRIGEVAKKAGININALRHYDKEGLLIPSATSESGYRLYSDKDMVKLVQILMMKQLGFSLSEIKKRLSKLDTAKDVMDMLTEQSAQVRKKIEILTESLNEMEMLNVEIAQIEEVNFKKYADILLNLQMKNERYWLVKHLDDDVLDTLMTRDNLQNDENMAKLIENANSYIKEAANLHDYGVSPESEKAHEFALRCWTWGNEVTGGDMSLLQKIHDQTKKGSTDKNHDVIMEKALLFMQSSMESYFSKLARENENNA